MKLIYSVRKIFAFLPIVAILAAISFCYCTPNEEELFLCISGGFRRTEMFMADGSIYCSVNLSDGQIVDDLPAVYGKLTSSIKKYNFDVDAPEIGEIVYESSEVKDLHESRVSCNSVLGAYRVLAGDKTASTRDLIYVVKGEGDAKQTILCARVAIPFSVYQYTNWYKYAELLQDCDTVLSTGCQSGNSAAYVSSKMSMTVYEPETWFFEKTVSRHIRMNWMCFFDDVIRTFNGEDGNCEHFK